MGFLFLGGSLGGGRLRHHGAEHAFTIIGLGTGSLGVSSLQARGEVFGFDRLGGFPRNLCRNASRTLSPGRMRRFRCAG